jgi:chemotaxis protein MotB
VSAPRGRRPRRAARGGSGGGHGGAGMERWLLTYADMITLLMALFIVMWAISAVNIGKFNELKASLRAAFSGKIFDRSEPRLLSGERSILNPEGAQVSPVEQLPSLVQAVSTAVLARVDRQDLENLRWLKREIDAYARRHGFAGRLRTVIDERGLVVRLLTDEVLFDTGKAVVKRPSLPLLARIASLLVARRIANPVRVEGHTDNVPISTPQFHSNWELSAARATAVVHKLLGHGVPASRLSVAGYADQRPVADNATPAGRRLNRRVELVVLRRSLSDSEVRP